MSGVLDVAGFGVVGVLLVIAAWAVIDAVRRPRAAWREIGRSKGLWLLGMIVGTYFLFGLIFVLLYLGGVRRELQELETEKET
jgi:hypothetical protein